MGEDPSTIRAEIEETRERMGDTVDALAYKADVKARAKESVSDKVDSLKSKVTGAKDSVTGGVVGAKDSVVDATPDGDQVRHRTRRAVGTAQENPLGLAIGAAAIGFVAGMLIPSTRVEDEKIGPVADQVKERAAETGQQALERGRQVAQDVAQQAAQTAKESGREQAQAAASDVQDAARETREQVVSS